MSVIAALKNIEGEVIVIDNNSNDGSREFFHNRFPEVKFVWNKLNVGFGAANNQALKLTTADYVVFLNPDTLIAEDCFEKCMGLMISKQNNAALGVRMIDGGGRFLKESKRAFPGPLTSLYKLAGLSTLFPNSKTFARYYLGYLDEHKNHEVDVLAGAFIMLSRNVLRAISGFDEDFFMYGEDVDLSYRIQKAGFKNYYCADTTIIHFKGESTKKGSLNYVKMFYKAMSIFVKKHYGSSRAGIFNFFIQTGIAVRGAMSAFSRFLKWIGMPVIDILTILFCFWIVKIFWTSSILPYLAYDSKILLITYPAFTLLFLLTSYYSGLYDNGFRQSRLNKSVLISTLILFTIYALVPESTQFSRAILLCSVALAFLMMSSMRVLLASLKIISKKKDNGPVQTAIAGTRKEFQSVLQILDYSKKEGLTGRVSVEGFDKHALAQWEDLAPLLKTEVIKELIYCQGKLSFKEIISSLNNLPSNVEAGFFADKSSGVIGSIDKNISGEYRSKTKYFRLSNPLYLRVKRLSDAGFALLFIITFPIHLFIKKKPLAFFKNCFNVLFASKTFIGYAGKGHNLPPLKASVITTTGLPAHKNLLPGSALMKSDTYYAQTYSVFTDLGLILKNYRELS